MDTAAWETLMPQMPYFALLRNLATLDRHDVFEDAKNVDYVANRLAEPQAVHKSKIFPFRFWNAYCAYTGANEGYRGFNPGTKGNPKIAQALADALELSFDNMPDIPGHTLIGMDTSGSMSGNIDSRSSTRYIDVASIFAVALMRQGTGEAIGFDTELHQLHINPKDSIMTSVSKISNPGGGTDCGIPARYANQKGNFDNLILITDSEEWHTSYSGYGGSYGFLAEWRKYRQKMPEAQCFYVRIAPYSHSLTPQKEPGILDFFGWNENVVKVIAMKAKGLQDQIAEIEAVDL
jgi:60 kDa SS-A/Ro ribonucleoprotein